MDKEEIFCYHCKQLFYLDSFRLREAKTVSCLYCEKRVDKKKAKIEGEKVCANCGHRQNSHVDFYDNSKCGKTCRFRQAMTFLEQKEEVKE